MLKFVRRHLFALSFSLLAMPGLVAAETVDDECLYSPANEQGLTNEELDYNCRKLSFSFHRDLRLKDLEGEWVFRSSSVGGLSGEDRIGTSVVIDGQVSIDRKGAGQVNFGAGAIYAGTPGTVDTFTISPNASIAITITDPDHSVGNMVITNPNRSYNETVDFIAIRSLGGRVVKLIGHRTSVTPQTSNLTSYTFERQN